MRGARDGTRSAILVLLAAVAAGCGGSSVGGTASPPVTLHAAPEPAVSPPAAITPAGRMVSVGHRPEGVAVGAAGLVAVAVRQPDGVDLVDLSSGSVRFVGLDGAARHLELESPAGPLLVPVESANRLDVLALPSGRVEASVPVGRHPHDVATLGSGRSATVVVGDELGNTLHLLREDRVVGVVPAPLQPGGLAATAGSVLVVGVRARQVVAVDAAGRTTSTAPAGAGPTHVVAGPPGIVFVADTLGGAVLSYRVRDGIISPLARIPVGPRPYGLAWDARRGWLYVTLTGSNRLLGLRTEGAAPTATRTWATGRQPNSVAVVPATGQVVVTDTDADQLQVIDP